MTLKETQYGRHCLWECSSVTNCRAVYSTLYELVSHVRNAHSTDSVTCDVDSVCQQKFDNASAWYWHVRHHHYDVYGTGKRKRFVGKDCDDDDDDAGRNTKDYKTDMAGDDAMLDIPLSTGSSMADNNDNTIDRCHYDDAVNDDKESPTLATNKFLAKSEREVQDVIMSWMIKLRQVHHLSGAAMSDVIELTKDVIVHFAKELEQAIEVLSYNACNSSCMSQLQDAVGNFMSTDVLDGLESQYKQQKYIKENYAYVEPVWHELSSCTTISTNTSDCNHGFYYIPILHSIQSLLSHRKVYDQVVSGPNCSESTTMHDVCDGTLFQNHPMFKDDPKALQIIVYYDEFTAVNPMAPTSQKYKLGAVYFMLGNIHPGLRSRLEAINLVCLFPYSLLAVHSFDEILRPLIADIKTLQEDGHTFIVHGQKLHLKGSLLCMVGDTPAVALAGGFKEGVGFANKKCRHCMANNEQIQINYTEEKFTLRNRTQHLQQCQLIEQVGMQEREKNHYSKVYGVNRQSILCDLPGFDVTAQLPQDIMHLLIEGLFHLQTKLFLSYLVNDIKVLTITDFNQRLKQFPNLYFEDKPHSITPASLSKGILGQTAHEMWQLFHIIPFLVGEAIPKHDQHLECFLLLNEISTILCADTISEESPSYLRVIVQDYLSMLKCLYPSLNLPPKAHYLVHCPSLLKKFGPIIRLWCMRFEGKHHEFKQLCRKTSFKNLLKTLTKHHQCRMAYNIQCRDVFASIKCDVGNPSATVLLKDLPYIAVLEDLFKVILQITLSPSEFVKRHNHASILGTCYRAQKCWLLTGWKENEVEAVPIFGILDDILQLDGSIVFVAKLMKTVAYDKHFAAYKVEHTSMYQCCFAESLKCHYLFSAVEVGNSTYVKSKYDLSGYKHCM